MKIVSNSIIRQGRTIVIETDLSEYHIQKLIQEISHIEKYEITIKQHKESRSIKQNKLLWAIIERISDEVNGSHREDDIWNVYKELLRRANVKYEIVAAERKAKVILEQHFRYVEELPNSMVTEKGKTLIAFRCYIGSSKFNTKEMTELIEAVKDYAAEYGIIDNEIALLEEAYKWNGQTQQKLAQKSEAMLWREIKVDV